MSIEIESIILYADIVLKTQLINFNKLAKMITKRKFYIYRTI